MKRSRIDTAFRQTALTCAALLISTLAAARPARIVQVPNGSVKGCATCHINPAGGGPRNGFGSEIEANFMTVPGSAGVVQWGPALAALDSDGDAKTNGQELRDPTGAWTMGAPAPGNPSQVTNPGEFEQTPAVPALSALATLCLAMGLGVGGARRVVTRSSSRASCVRKLGPRA